MADHDDDSVKLALLAHDLRTPLAAMRLTAELIGQKPLAASQSEQLAILIQSIDALTDLTGELVRAAEPGTRAEAPAIRIADVVRECAGLFEIAAAARNLKWSVVVAQDAEAAQMRHAGALRRVVTTLLDNAVKYTSAGRIDVRVAAAAAPKPGEDGSSSWLRVSVSDSGPGIDPEESARLFRPFVRGRHGRETAPGTGLGLWGTAQLVHEMGGQLRLTSPETGGSTFEVLLPVAGTGDPAAPAGTGGSPVSQASASHGQLRKHVLIVDDNDTNCRLLSALLESFGATCEIAKSGAQAIAMVGQNSYDAVLLDLHMPGLSGVETAEALRGLKKLPRPPLIAVTAALESMREDELKAAGFEDLLAKPLSPSALYEILQRLRPASGEAADETRS